MDYTRSAHLVPIPCNTIRDARRGWRTNCNNCIPGRKKRFCAHLGVIVKVFYSWQSDLDRSRHSDFIRSAIKAALADQPSLELEDAQRPELDEAGVGRADAESIISVILKKISDAAVIVADVTPITVVGKDKLTPNPNVLYELGYAAAKLSNRLILVMNSAEGHRPKDMPFDIAQRPIIIYSLPSGATPPQQREALKQLTKMLAGAIAANLAGARRKITDDAEIRPHGTNPGDPSVWFEKGSFRAQGNHGRSINIIVKPQPRSFLRIIPAGWQADRVPGFDGFRKFTNGERTIAPSPDYALSYSGDVLYCPDGAVRYYRLASAQNSDDIAADTLAVLFDSTGEIWVINNLSMFQNGKKEWVLDLPYTLRCWQKSLADGIAFMDAFQASGRRQIIAGVNVVQRTMLPVGQHNAREGMKRNVVVQEESTDWSPETQRAFLLKLFNKVRAAYALPAEDMSAMEQTATQR